MQRLQVSFSWAEVLPLVATLVVGEMQAELGEMQAELG